MCLRAWDAPRRRTVDRHTQRLRVPARVALTKKGAAEFDKNRKAGPYSAGIGVAGAVGAVAAGEGAVGPFSGRSSMEMRNAMPNDSTSAQARNTKRNA